MTDDSKEPAADPTVDFINRASRLFENNFDIDASVAIKYAGKLNEFIIEEEFTDEVNDDLKEGFNGSILVSTIAELLSWGKDAQLEVIWSALKILFHLDSSPLTNLKDLDWNVSENEMNDIRDTMAKQCTNMIKDGEDVPMIKIMAVGKKNEYPNLLCLLHDAFTKYRLEHVGDDIETEQFAGFTKELTSQGLDKENIHCISAALRSFQHRLVSRFNIKATPSKLIDDKCEVFIQYTCMVAKALKNFVDKAKERCAVLPLQADLIIIPKAYAAPKEDMFDFDDDDPEDDDDDPEEDDDDDPEENDQEVKDDTTVVPLEKIFEEVMSKGRYKAKVTEGHTNTQGGAWRNLANAIGDHVHDQHSRRISIVINRQKDPNTIYVYALPEKNMIPKAYCITTLVHMAKMFVIPASNANMSKAEQFPFQGGGNGHFLISFQMMNDDNTRLQWFFQQSGMRLTPEVMVNIWPKIFKSCKLSKEYTAENVKEMLNLSYPMFDNWWKSRIKI